MNNKKDGKYLKYTGIESPILHSFNRVHENYIFRRHNCLNMIFQKI